MNIDEIVTLLHLADSPARMIDIFNKYKKELEDFQLIFAGDENNFFPDKDTPDRLSADEVVPEPIINIYGSKRLYYLNSKTSTEFMLYGTSTSQIDPIMLLDTNVVSYLLNIPNNKDHPLHNRVMKIIHFLFRHNFSSDGIFYYIENHESINGVDADKIFKNLLELERFNTADRELFLRSGKLQSCFSEKGLANRVKRNISGFKRGETSINMQKYLKLLLLKMIEIQIKQPYAKTKDKISEFVDFMDNEIGANFSALLLIAIEYFQKGQHLGFFSKFQKGNKNIDVCQECNNMTMDLMYLYHLQYIHTAPSDGADYCVPYALSFDKKLLELLKIVELRFCLYSIKTRQIFPAFRRSSEKLLAKIFGDDYEQFTERYFSQRALIVRAKRRCNFDDSMLNLSDNIERTISLLIR